MPTTFIQPWDAKRRLAGGSLDVSKFLRYLEDAYEAEQIISHSRWVVLSYVIPLEERKGDPLSGVHTIYKNSCGRLAFAEDSWKHYQKFMENKDD